MAKGTVSGSIQPRDTGSSNLKPGERTYSYISAVERAGLSTLNEGQVVEYDVVANRGKEAAEKLKVK